MIGHQNHLTAIGDHRVQRLDQFGLRGRFGRQQLHIVDQQQAIVANEGAERLAIPALAHDGHELLDE
ncbi:hypothetical protein D3C83_132980 [compost metagenome]